MTVSKVLPRGPLVYPEYDKLLADKKLDVLVLFGQVDHGTLSSSDYAFSLISNSRTPSRWPASARPPARPRGANTLGKIVSGAEKGGTASWQNILKGMNDIAGEESFYGASGVR